MKLEIKREPQDYIIRKEPILLKQGYAYHVYQKDGTPLYLGGLTIPELEARLRRGYPVKSISIEQ